MHPSSYSFELLYVNDGSKDKTSAILTELQHTKPFLKVVEFVENKGQTAAFDAGFKAAQGKWIVALDGDLQNNPADIPQLLEIAEKGSYDLVAGKRAQRCDSFLKRIISSSANFVRQSLLKDGISDTGCSLKVMRREVLNKIKLYKGMHRFFPALFLIEGASIKEQPVDHRYRIHGQSKYSFFSRGISLLLDLFAVMWMSRRHISYTIKDRECQ